MTQLPSITLLPRASILIRATPHKQAYIGLILQRMPCRPIRILEGQCCGSTTIHLSRGIQADHSVMVSLRHAAIRVQVVCCTLVIIKSVQVLSMFGRCSAYRQSLSVLAVTEQIQTLQEPLRDALTASGTSADRAVLHTCCIDPQHCNSTLGPASD